MDAILYQKQRQAEWENIKWECDVRMPKECCINEFDLCVLFGNILDIIHCNNCKQRNSQYDIPLSRLAAKNRLKTFGHQIYRKYGKAIAKTAVVFNYFLLQPAVKEYFGSAVSRPV